MRLTMKVLSFLITAFSLLFSVSINASWPEGNWYWSTKFGRDVLKFGTNNYLVYQSFYNMHDEKNFYSLFGTWKYQLSPCVPGDKQEVNEATTAEGSLMLYINPTQCCLNVARQGNKIALTKAWVKGSGLAVHAYCSDNILIPFEAASD